MKVALVDDTLEERQILSSIIDKELPQADVFTFSDGLVFKKLEK